MRHSCSLIVPSGPPQSVTAATKGSKEIAVEWQNVLPIDRNGIILGYKVFYREVGQFAVNRIEKVQEVNDGSAVQTALAGLQEYVDYNISVLAFTSKGDGPKSTEITVRTGQIGMYQLKC